MSELDAAEYLLESAKKKPAVRALIDEASELHGLTEHAGWRALLKSVRSQKDQFMLHIARRLMAGAVLDQRDIDFKRGYFQGALDTLERPETAVKNLELSARAAYIAAQAEIARDTEGDDSPYLS